ncbi:hypothetical protein Cus16_0437 [Curtobacterium sp. ER1/6]|nr:hypothetical protein Cus16_0437 [Curtobacterium sp. ER1/6]
MDAPRTCRRDGPGVGPTEAAQRPRGDALRPEVCAGAGDPAQGDREHRGDRPAVLGSDERRGDQHPGDGGDQRPDARTRDPGEPRFQAAQPGPTRQAVGVEEVLGEDEPDERGAEGGEGRTDLGEVRGERPRREHRLVDRRRGVGHTAHGDRRRRQGESHREDARDDAERQEQAPCGGVQAAGDPRHRDGRVSRHRDLEQRERRERQGGGGAEDDPRDGGRRQGEDERQGQERSRGHHPMQPAAPGRRVRPGWQTAWRHRCVPQDG